MVIEQYFLPRALQIYCQGVVFRAINAERPFASTSHSKEYNR